MVSAKQRKARQRFAFIMKHGGFKKQKGVHKFSIMTIKNKRKRSHNPPMARKRGSSTRTIVRTVRRGASRGRGMLGGVMGFAKPVAAGIGGGMLVTEVANRVMPQAAPIAGLAGAWLFGGIKGVIGKVAYDAVTGQGGLMGLFGGGGGAGGDSL